MFKNARPHQTIVLIFLLAVFVSAEIPRLIAYQGILTDAKGNPRADGKYPVKFSFYDVESGGSALWNEEDSVSTQQGMFGVMLGENKAISLPFDKQYWLGVTVDGKNVLPRVKLASAAYCLRADTANVAISAKKAEKADTAKYISGGAATKLYEDTSFGTCINSYRHKFTLFNEPGTVSQFSVLANGNVGIGTVNPGNDAGWGTRILDISGTRGTLMLRTTSEYGISTLRMTGIGSNSIDDWHINMYSGPSSTLEFQPKSGSLGRGAGLVLKNDGNVGIGTTNPQVKLDIHGGRLRVSNSDPDSAGVIEIGNKMKTNFIFTDSTIGNLNLRTDSPSRHIILQTGGLQGNVGIGTTDPKSKLQVVGLPEYSDNAAAIAAGLTAGAFYRTGDLLKVVH